MSRKRFSESMVIETLARQGFPVECYRCHDLVCVYDGKNVFWFGGPIEREHVTEISLGGADDPSNCVYSHKACHKIITNGTKATSAGSSKHRKAKVDRILGLTCTGPKKKIQSRPFQKDRSRSFRWQEGNVRDVNADLQEEL